MCEIASNKYLFVFVINFITSLLYINPWGNMRKKKFVVFV